MHRYVVNAVVRGQSLLCGAAAQKDLCRSLHSQWVYFRNLQRTRVYSKVMAWCSVVDAFQSIVSIEPPRRAPTPPVSESLNVPHLQTLQTRSKGALMERRDGILSPMPSALSIHVLCCCCHELKFKWFGLIRFGSSRPRAFLSLGACLCLYHSACHKRNKATTLVSTTTATSMSTTTSTFMMAETSFQSKTKTDWLSFRFGMSNRHWRLFPETKAIHPRSFWPFGGVSIWFSDTRSLALGNLAFSVVVFLSVCLSGCT